MTGEDKLSEGTTVNLYAGESLPIRAAWTAQPGQHWFRATVGIQGTPGFLEEKIDVTVPGVTIGNIADLQPILRYGLINTEVYGNFFGPFPAATLYAVDIVGVARIASGPIQQKLGYAGQWYGRIFKDQIPETPGTYRIRASLATDGRNFDDPSAPRIGRPFVILPRIAKLTMKKVLAYLGVDFY